VDQRRQVLGDAAAHGPDGRRVLLERAPPDQGRGQGLALDQLHHDERPPVGFAVVEHAGDVRVEEPGCSLGLPPEPLHEPLVGGQPVVEDLHRDRPAEIGVLRPPDRAHPARGDALEQPVPVAEHRGR